MSGYYSLEVLLPKWMRWILTVLGQWDEDALCWPNRSTAERHLWQRGLGSTPGVSTLSHCSTCREELSSAGAPVPASLATAAPCFRFAGWELSEMWLEFACHSVLTSSNCSPPFRVGWLGLNKKHGENLLVTSWMSACLWTLPESPSKRELRLVQIPHVYALLPNKGGQCT